LRSLTHIRFERGSVGAKTLVDRIRHDAPDGMHGDMNRYLGDAFVPLFGFLLPLLKLVLTCDAGHECWFMQFYKLIAAMRSHVHHRSGHDPGTILQSKLCQKIDLSKLSTSWVDKFN
jgi:hypothetical protein